MAGEDFRKGKINSNGQVTIPKEIREKENLEEGDSVIIQDTSGTITVNKLDEEKAEKLRKAIME